MTKKDQIIDAAVKEFGHYNYDAASINRIIKASGTSKGTFYHYFTNKKDLFFAILNDAIEIKQAYYSRMMKQVQEAGGDFFDMLKAQAKAGAEFMQENPALYLFGIQFANETGPIRQEFNDKYMPGLADSFLKVVEAGVAAKTITSLYPPEFITRIIWFMTLNYFDILFDKGEAPSPEKIEQRLDMLFDFMKRGFSQTAAGQEKG